MICSYAQWQRVKFWAMPINFEVVLEMQKLESWIWKQIFNILTFTRIWDKFEVYSTVKGMGKQQCGRWCTTSEGTSVMVSQQFICSLKKSVRWCASETGISKSSANWILKTTKWKCYMPGLLHAVNEDNPDRRLEYCEWVQRKLDTVSGHDCLDWWGRVYSRKPATHQELLHKA
jgi:hypothetical protein